MAIEFEHSPEHEEFANWHPETEATEDQLLAGLEYEVPNPDETIRSEAEALLGYAKKPEQEQSQESRIRNFARDFYEKYAPVFQERIVEISKLFDLGQADQAESLKVRLIQEVKYQSGSFLLDKVEEYYSQYEQDRLEAETERDPLKKSKLYKLAAEAVNFIPVIGSAKMIGEGLSGRTMAGERLSKGQRIWHATEGAVFLALDLTGVGIAAAENLKAGRAVTRTAALMRSVGMAREVYTPVYKTGRFLIENPLAAKSADQAFSKIIQARKKHASLLAEQGRNTLFEQAEEQDLARAA